MIVKGKTRSGGAQLAAYLMRQDGTEAPQLLQLFDVSDDLRTALVRWDLIGEATRAEHTLYHAQICPEEKYGKTMTPAEWLRSADILAQELGMEHHPRAVVLHDGGDKPHAHVVFQRTDVETMKAWHNFQNYEKHEKASKRMALEFGHELIPGKHAKRDRKKQPEFPRQAFDQAEAQQAKRQDVNPKERKEQITALRQSCDNSPAFRNALEEAGYILARGDKRDFMLVDQDGEALSLSRQVRDLKAKEFKAFMAPLDPATLPTVDEAKVIQSERAVKAQQQGQEASQFLPPEPTFQPPQPTPAPQDAELEEIKKALAARQAKEAEKWADLHAQELRQLEFDLENLNRDKTTDFDATQQQEREALKSAHREQRSGLKGFLDAIQSRWNPQLAAEKTKARRKEIRDLKRRQDREREDYLALIEQTKQMEIENLKDRQTLKMLDVRSQQQEEQERYIREHHDAKRILAEMEAQAIHEELEHNDSLRDGPPPPKLGKP